MKYIFDIRDNETLLIGKIEYDHQYRKGSWSIFIPGKKISRVIVYADTDLEMRVCIHRISLDMFRSTVESIDRRKENITHFYMISDYEGEFKKKIDDIKLEIRILRKVADYLISYMKEWY